MRKTYQNKWTCSFESHEPIVKSKAVATFKQMYFCSTTVLRIPARLDFRLFHLKKRNKRLITIISGPHGQNKSREQYVIKRYKAILTVKDLNALACQQSLDLGSFESTKKAESITSSGVSCVHSWKEKILVKL